MKIVRKKYIRNGEAFWNVYLSAAVQWQYSDWWINIQFNDKRDETTGDPSNENKVNVDIIKNGGTPVTNQYSKKQLYQHQHHLCLRCVYIYTILLSTYATIFRLCKISEMTN